MPTLPVAEAAARLHELIHCARLHQEHFTLTFEGRPEAVLLSVDELEGFEATLEVLADAESVAAVAKSLEQEGGASGQPSKPVGRR